MRASRVVRVLSTRPPSGRSSPATWHRHFLHGQWQIIRPPDPNSEDCLKTSVDNLDGEELVTEDDYDDDEYTDWPQVSPASRKAVTRVPVVVHRINHLSRGESASDYVDLSDSFCHLVPLSSDSPIKVGFNTFGSGPIPPQPFPKGTTGFFYCVTYPNIPLATELRFRIVPNRGGTFGSGYDLLKAKGLPWNIPLLAMLKDNHAFSPLIELMKSDKIIPQSLILHGSSYGRLIGSKEVVSSVVHSFGKPFYYSFLRRRPALLWIVGPGLIRPLHTYHLFTIKHMSRMSQGKKRQDMESLVEPTDGWGWFSLEPSIYDDGIAVRCLKLIPGSNAPQLTMEDSVAQGELKTKIMSVREGQLLGGPSGAPFSFGALGWHPMAEAVNMLYSNYRMPT
ncbi:hypothetical protein C8Q74DRAFT_1252338 [Fomes fomentarius]|nr:hypothetical protein C8Q74DRAFT_1252338 [Fomes fomentarius]